MYVTGTWRLVRVVGVLLTVARGHEALMDEYEGTEVGSEATRDKAGNVGNSLERKLEVTHSVGRWAVRG